MAKKRVTLWLDAEVYDELAELFQVMPGKMTVSAFIRQVMAESLPPLRSLWEAAQQGDREKIAAMVDGVTGLLFARVGPEVAAIHQWLAAGQEEEDVP